MRPWGVGPADPAAWERLLQLIFGELARETTASALQVLAYIAHRTVAVGIVWSAESLAEIGGGTGLPPSTVRFGLAHAQERGLLLRRRTRRASQPYEYALVAVCRSQNMAAMGHFSESGPARACPMRKQPGGVSPPPGYQVATVSPDRDAEAGKNIQNDSTRNDLDCQ